MSAPTTKKKAPRKTAPVVPEVKAPDEFDPVAVFDAVGLTAIPGGVQLGKKGRTPREVVPLFTTSKGKSYSMTAPSTLLCWEYLERLRSEGPDQANLWLLSASMGEEARVALAVDPDATEEDAASVYTIVARVAFGAIKKFREATEGKS